MATELPANLRRKATAMRAYTVRLHFVEPWPAKAGDRVFSVALEGKTVIEDFDIVREAGLFGSSRTSK
jgi:hypothetical protein